MSTTIDQRVVEMRFDNKQFERGVSDTMSTLEKLKQKLNFNGAVKGVESVNSAAKGVNANMSSLGGAVEQVSLKFSALQVMGVTALTRLTNSAITAGTRIAKALTIEPVTTGFQEYETQINAVQTILANTSHAGTTIDDVNKALDDLNKYADQTIYNFTEMTRNIGTFTAAGVDLETSTSAIKGIANLAAVSGSTSQQASTAMYQLSQALAAGRVSLMDWNSVVNAGMGGKVFQDALTRTSEVMGTGAKAAIEKYGSFRESLTQGEWLTTDVLTETLNQFTMAAEEGTAQWEEYKKSLKEKGYTEEQAVEILKMANTATNAATKVKTFTQLWDVLKESAQSGWSQTWKLIIGDFEEAKNLLTPISESLTEFINRMSDFRNAILESALGRTFSSLGDKINTILKPAAKAADVVKGAADKIADLGVIVDDVILGKFGNGKERFDALTKAGVNYCEVQNKVNEKLGNSYRYTQEQIDAQNKLLGTQTKTTEKTKEQGEETVKLTDAQKKQLKELGKMNDAQLRQKGYTDEQIKALRDLQKVAENLGIPFDKFIDQLDQINGRWLLINGFKNIGNMLTDVGRAIGKAWNDIFFPKNNAIEVLSDKLFNLLGTFHRVTAAMADVFYVKVGTKGKAEEPIYKLTEAGEKLVRTFKGVFAALDVVGTLIGGGFKIAFKIVAELFDRFGLSILDVTAIVGDALVKFRDWVDSILNVSGAVDFLVPLVKKAAKFVSDLVNAVKNSKWFADFCGYVNKAADGLSNLFSSIPNMDAFQKLVQVLKDAGKAVRDWIETLKDSENIPGDIIAGLVKGITGGIPAVIAAVFDLAKSIISGICEVLGIASPAKTMITIGGFIIAGLIQGIAEGKIQLVDTVGGLAADIWASMKTAFGYLGERIKGLLEGVWEFVSTENNHIDWGKLFAGGMLGSLLWVLIQFANAFKGLTDSIGGIGDILDNAGEAMNSFRKVLDGYSWDLKAGALQKLAISIAILAGAIVVLAQVDDIGKLWNAVGIIAALAGILVILSVAMDKLSNISARYEKGKGFSVDGLKSGLMQIALAIGILAFAVKMIGDMDADKAETGFKRLGIIALGLLGFAAIMGVISKLGGGMRGLGKTMIGLTLSLTLMLGVAKLAASMDPADIITGALAIQAFVILIAEMALINKLCGTTLGDGQRRKGVAGSIMAMAFSMLLMLAVAKIASSMDPADIVIGALAIQAFVILMAEMAIVNRLAGTNNKIGGTILSMTASILLIVGAIKLVSSLDVADVVKGIIAIQAFLVLIIEMLLIAKLGKNTGAVASTILSMAVAIGILAGISLLLSKIDIGSLFRGIIAVGALGTIMAIMTRSLKGAQNAQGAVMWLAIGVGILAAAAFALSYIPVEKLLPSVAALSIMMLSFAAMAKTATKIKTNFKSLLSLVAVAVLLGSVLAIFSLLDVGSTIEIAGSIGLLMTTMGITMSIIGKTGVLARAAIVPMAYMTIVMAAVGAVLVVLSKLNPGPMLEIAVALSGVLLAMSASALILSRIGPFAAAGVIGAASFLGLVAAAGTILAVIGGLVAKIDGAQEFLENGIPILDSIGRALGALIGGLIGGIGEGITASLPVIVENIKEFTNGLVDVSESASNIEPGSFDGVSDLVDAMLGISIGALVEHFASSITGESSITSFQTSAEGFVTAMGAISKKLDGVTINETAIETITKCGSMFAELNNSLPRKGGLIQDLIGEQDLDSFSVSCGAFVAAMIEVNAAVSGDDFTVQSDRISAIVAAGERFNELQNALPRTGGLIQDLAGEQDLSGFAAACKAFVTTMIEVNTAVSAENFVVQSDKISQLVSAGERFSALQNALPRTGGLVQDLAGEKELGPFGVACAAFAAAMIAVNDAVSIEGFSVSTEAIQQLCDAGTKFNDLQNSLPKTGGWWQEIAGESDLADFGKKIKAYGTALSEYSGKVTGIDTAAISSSIGIANRIKSLIESLVGLDTSGITAFTGVGTGGWGADGAAYKIAQAISEYSTQVSGINTEAVSTSVSAATKLKSLIAGLVGLDTSGIENFKPDEIGSAMKTYGDKVSGIDTAIVSSSISAANRLKTLITSLVGLDTSGISSFKPQSIGDALKTYGGSVAGMNTAAVNQSITLAGRLKTFISGLAGLDTSGVGSFKTAIDDLSTVEVSKVVKAFSGASEKLSGAGVKMITGLVQGLQSGMALVGVMVTTILKFINTALSNGVSIFEKAGVIMMAKLASGIASKSGSVKSAVAVCIAMAALAINLNYTKFFSAGTYLGSGLALGIASKQTAAYNAGYALGQAAVQGEKDGQKSKSPSKLTIQAGKWFGEGLVIGIKKMGDKVYDAGHKLGDTAVKSLSSTISGLATAIDSDIDVQPTIRPVLDLSDVRSGAGAIGSMLGAGSSVGVLARVGAISNSMNRRGQNGNAEIVSELNKLRKDLANVNNTTYTINGITYDDGSNIANTVKDLTRYARLEGRV